MKVLMVFTSKFHYTGITSVVMNYYRELIKMENCKIDFIVPNNIDNDFKKEFKDNNTKVYQIPMKIRRMFPIIYIYKLIKIMKKEKYDIVHVHGSSAIMAIDLLAAKFACVPTRIAHSHNTVTEHKILHRLLNPLFNQLYTDAFACGKDAGKWLFGNRKFYVLPNAQDISKFIFDPDKRKEYRKKYDLDNKIVIGHVGAFNHQKNHDFLIDVFSELNRYNKNYYLVLIGEGSLFEDIKIKIKRLRLENYILFVGKSKKVNEWLNAMDIMLLQSIYEGLPNVLIEWQISGLKCIVSDKVTREAQLTNLISYEELNKQKWIETILKSNINENRNNEDILNLIRKSGFDIVTNARELFFKYQNLEKNGGK